MLELTHCLTAIEAEGIKLALTTAAAKRETSPLAPLGNLAEELIKAFGTVDAATCPVASPAA